MSATRGGARGDFAAAATTPAQATGASGAGSRARIREARAATLPPMDMLGLPRPAGSGLGAMPLGTDRCAFRVWAPAADDIALVIEGDRRRVIPLEPEGAGYHHVEVDDCPTGTRYRYRLRGRDLADPASRLQPEGVHGPSAVVAADYAWGDDGWAGLPFESFVIYELHVGTFSREGTFDGVIPHLDTLRELGVTALELMPVAEFPGARNWGYDGVFPFAVHSAYGGPDGLRRLVDACHRRGMAVVLDVVYNHLGPEGSCLAEYGPYFTDRYHTPWGDALDFDGPKSDEVRRYFIENALYWITDLHLDGLRLDAVHAIVDNSAYPFLEELAAAVHERARHLNRQVYLIAESDRNDPRLVTPRELGGIGLDAQWSDDFHHALHTLLTGESDGYYADYGTVEHMVRAYRHGFVYTGQYSSYRRRRHGRPGGALAGHQLVVFSQNHDQVGNRMMGERLSSLVSFEAVKLAAGVVLLAPAVPLLFMGEEYGETAPFGYFVSHSDPALIEAVRRGRRQEFNAFGWRADPPDAADESVFRDAVLHRELAEQSPNRELRRLYRELLRLRRTVPALARLDPGQQEASQVGSHVMVSRRWHGISHTVAFFNFSDAVSDVRVRFPAGVWRKELDSADESWGGPGSPAPRDIVVTDGETLLELPPQAFVLYSSAG